MKKTFLVMNGFKRHFYVMAILLSLLLLVSTLPEALAEESPEREWEKIFGDSDYFGAQGYSVEQTSDGGFIVAGHKTSYDTNGEVYLLKTDGEGNSLWEKTFGGAEGDYAYSVKQTMDGGFIIAGYTYSYGAGFYDVYVIKTDGEGNSLWEKTFGGAEEDIGYSVLQTRDGGFVIAGLTYSSGSGNGDVYLIKLDILEGGDVNQGEEVILAWEKTFGGAGFDMAYSIQQTTDGGFIVTGETDSFGTSYREVYLLRIEENGDFLWEKTFGGSTIGNTGRSVQQTSDGGFIIGGHTYSGIDYQYVYLIKTDGDGNFLWEKTLGGSSVNGGYSIEQTTDGGFIVTGFTYSWGNGYYGAGGYDAYLLKTDDKGNLLWDKTLGYNLDDYGYSVKQTSDGGFIVTGTTFLSGSGISGVYLVKVKTGDCDKCDLNGDGVINVNGDIFDYWRNNCFLTTNGITESCDLCDLDGDGVIDVQKDLRVFWKNTCLNQ